MLLKRSSCQSFAPKYGYIGFGVRGINGYIKFSIGAWRKTTPVCSYRVRELAAHPPLLGDTHMCTCSPVTGRLPSTGRCIISRAISVPLYLKRRPFRESGMLELMNFLRQDNDGGGTLPIKFASIYTPLRICSLIYILLYREIHTRVFRILITIWLCSH